MIINIADRNLFSAAPDAISELIYSQYNLTLAGGALRALISNTNIEDYDFFHSGPIPEYLFQEIKDTLFMEYETSLVFECPNGELFTFKTKTGEKIQIITKATFANETELINTFDFSICQFALKGKGGMDLAGTHEIVTGTLSLQDLINKRLRIVNVTYPVATINRIHKYRKKGFHPNEMDYRFLFNEIKDKTFDPDQLQLYID